MASQPTEVVLPVTSLARFAGVIDSLVSAPLLSRLCTLTLIFLVVSYLSPLAVKNRARISHPLTEEDMIIYHYRKLQLQVKFAVASMES